MSSILQRLRIYLGTGILTIACTAAASAEDLFLTDGKAFPGQLWLSQAGISERSIHRRPAVANPAVPHAVMKLGQVAVGPEGDVYFCSGLDGYVIHLKDGQHEVQSFEFGGQVRDLACTGEEHTLYFSVVATPQDGQPLGDGKIYRRDLWDGRPAEIATVRQADIGGNWWGCFTVRNGAIYIATHEDRSRLFKLTSDGPQAVYPDNTFSIRGLSTAADGSFYFVNGSDKVYRTTTFADAEVAFSSERPFTDVSLRGIEGAAGP